MLPASRLVIKNFSQKREISKTVPIGESASDAAPMRPTALRQVYLKHELARKSNIYRAKNT